MKIEQIFIFQLAEKMNDPNIHALGGFFESVRTPAYGSFRLVQNEHILFLIGWEN